MPRLGNGREAAPEASLRGSLEPGLHQSSHNLGPSSLLYVHSKSLYRAKWTTKSFKSHSKEALPPNSLSLHKAHAYTTENTLKRRMQNSPVSAPWILPICKMASPPAHKCLSSYFQYLLPIFEGYKDTWGEHQEKKWVEKYIFNIKGKEERKIHF